MFLFIIMIPKSKCFYFKQVVFTKIEISPNKQFSFRLHTHTQLIYIIFGLTAGEYMFSFSTHTCIQNVRQNSNKTKLTILTSLLQNVFIQNLKRTKRNYIKHPQLG